MTGLFMLTIRELVTATSLFKLDISKCSGNQFTMFALVLSVIS